MPRGFEAAEKVFVVLKQKQAIGCISASAVTDIHYFLHKRFKDSDVTILLLKKLIRILEVVAVDRRTIEAAIDSGMKDFEDAVQAEAAKTRKIDIVVTRDKIGFADSGLTVLSPAEFAERLEKT